MQKCSSMQSFLGQKDLKFEFCTKFQVDHMRVCMRTHVHACTCMRPHTFDFEDQILNFRAKNSNKRSFLEQRNAKSEICGKFWSRYTHACMCVCSTYVLTYPFEMQKFNFCAKKLKRTVLLGTRGCQIQNLRKIWGGVHVCMYVCMYMYVPIHTCTYIHTYSKVP